MFHTEKYFQFKGRASRKEYFSFLIFDNLLLLLLRILIKLTTSKVIAVLVGAYLFTSLVHVISVTVRRMHDINLSGWWCVMLTIIGVVSTFF
ncbi:MAG TPA: DUF805 domain-containing protein [Rickettsia endosymbiont of Columbicola hoogstraali]|nr:DUF805 domain-containing protein [Rickettsia endosymbiont of Columbicola hoogstraali]